MSIRINSGSNFVVGTYSNPTFTGKMMSFTNPLGKKVPTYVSVTAENVDTAGILQSAGQTYYWTYDSVANKIEIHIPLNVALPIDVLMSWLVI